MSRSPSFPPEDTVPLRALRRVGPWRAALAVAAVLLLTVVCAVAGGYRAGLAKNASLAATQTAAEAARQYQLGLDDLAAGRLFTAGERFRYVLSLDPGYAGAAEKLGQVEAALAQTAAAPPALTAATQPAQLAQTPGAQPADVLDLAEAALAAGDWDQAITLLDGLQQGQPDFEPARVQADFQRAYQERGVARIDADRLQEGILDLDRAETYGALSEEAEARRVWATLYVRGNALWGADWPSSIAIFEDLYRAAPYFHDTISKLHGAYVGYGDQLWAQGDPCGGAVQYARAGEVLADAAVDDKRRAAEAACAAITPTPEGGAPTATPEGTTEATVTPGP